MMRIAFTALLSIAALLNVFLAVFGNSNVFPLGSADFLFFVALSFFFSLSRPGWAFLLLLSLLPFETVNLAPHAISLSVRPYQLLGAALAASLFLRFLFRRFPFSLEKFRWFDALPLLFALGGFLSITSSSDPKEAAKQATVALSFVALYFLSRQFLSHARDARRVAPFLSVAAVLAVLFALWQSIRFTIGYQSFEVMPGRPNAFFPEPDWLGMFLVLSGSLALSFIFFVLEKNSSEKKGESGMKSEGLSKGDGDGRGYFGVSHNSLFFTLCFSLLTLSVLGLFLTVSRSAWVGLLFSSILFLKLLLVGKYPWNLREWRWNLFAQGGATIAASCALALLVVWAFRLTTFSLTERAGSAASGWQEITVSCETPVSLPENIGNVSELPAYGCRFIRLEEIDAEKSVGKFVSTVFRPDPSIEARRAIREKTTTTLKSHWLFGIGWGSIGSVLGTDERGAKFNASNAFLESWFGGGLVSFASFLFVWLLLPVFALRKLFFESPGDGDDTLEGRAVAVFFLVSWVGFTVFNLFNSGILLGFVWMWLGGIGMAATKR